eukprot:SAG22_NODE_727_length_7598_cov_89.922523_5_plen_135_part_00
MGQRRSWRPPEHAEHEVAWCGVSSKALPFCCASTGFLSKIVPFLVVCLSSVAPDGELSKALPLSCVSTVFLSKTAPFRAVPLPQARVWLVSAIAAAPMLGLRRYNYWREGPVHGLSDLYSYGGSVSAGRRTSVQ